MKYMLLILFTVCSQMLAEDKIFRCNLDDRTRILVFQSGKYYAAYDTHKGSFWKYWKSQKPNEGIKFEGAVYDGRHGPQPSSLGSIIVESTEKNVWRLGTNQAKYSSYSPVRKNFTCTILRPNKSQIKIVESPQFTSDKLIRSISVSGLNPGESITQGSIKISQNGQTQVEVK